MMRMLAERSIWYSLSESVWLGAMTMESPVCTPMASRFSMLQMVMQVSAPSRITSYSISRQPTSERSIRTWWIGLAASPLRTTSASSSIVVAKPPPVPPSVYAGRTTSGIPSPRATSMPSASSFTTALSGVGSPMRFSRSRNSSRSSAVRIVSIGVPSERTP